MALIEEAGFQAQVVGRGAVADSDSAILRVSGMTCSSCSSAVELALLNHEGVQVRSSRVQCNSSMQICSRNSMILDGPAC